MKSMFSFKTLYFVLVLSIVFLGARSYMGVTNFDRLVLGSGNFGTDPNATADLTFQNDEYIDNVTDGRLNFGAANLLTTGTVGGGALTVTTATGTYFISDANVGRARFTVGTTAGTGAGKLYGGDSLYIGTTLFADASRNIAVGTITGSGFISDVLAGRKRATVGTAAGTGAGRLYAGDSIYVGTTLFADVSRNVSAGTISGTTGTFTGLLTLAANGGKLALRTIAAGDSVFGHLILDAADTTIKVWSGTAWRTVADVGN